MAKMGFNEKPLRRKTKTKGVRWWKKKVWKEVFSPYIRLRDALETTGTKDTLLCCSCGRPYPAFGKPCAQAGHFIPGRGAALLFDERSVHGQCYNCNITLKGNWPKYMKFMMDKYGRKVVDELLHLNNTIKKYNPVELEKLYETYKQKLKLLKQMDDLT